MYCSLPGSSVYGLLPPGESTPIAQGPVGLPSKGYTLSGFSYSRPTHCLGGSQALETEASLEGVIDRGHVGGREEDKESRASSFGARWRAAAGRRVERRLLWAGQRTGREEASLSLLICAVGSWQPCCLPTTLRRAQLPPFLQSSRPVNHPGATRQHTREGQNDEASGASELGLVGESGEVPAGQHPRTTSSTPCEQGPARPF